MHIVFENIFLYEFCLPQRSDSFIFCVFLTIIPGILFDKPPVSVNNICCPAKVGQQSQLHTRRIFL